MSEVLRAPQQATAALHLAHRVPVAEPGQRADELRRAMVGQRFDSARDIAVVDAGLLVGIVRIEDLLAASGDDTLRDIMDPDPPSITAGTDQELAAWHAVRHQKSSIAVVDDNGSFKGMIPSWRMLEVVLREHDEDMARIGGFLHDAEAARCVGLEGIARRFWHRIPWLLVGLAGALVAAAIVGRFEEQLQANLLVALFIPGIVYMADAVGTQTETLLIRGLSVGIPVRQVVGRELMTGLLVGVVLAGLFIPIGLAAWGDVEVIIAVAMALFGACSTATIVAMVLPALLKRLGVDPAFGSGPLATVIQDLLSILIYFAIVGTVVGT